MNVSAVLAFINVLATCILVGGILGTGIVTVWYMLRGGIIITPHHTPYPYASEGVYRALRAREGMSQAVTGRHLAPKTTTNEGVTQHGRAKAARA